ncbi:hypothetical protein AYI68_g6915 [Smittium mucronatum]|uniref:Uncharacterized protein n=1 Tax=Smittium mucronatum TaxID=133383 RepID=A0A1R0GQ77_9FUNG|nr:hypothetical protein AYI68_g6915 [Smittium mucronatum]
MAPAKGLPDSVPLPYNLDGNLGSSFFCYCTKYYMSLAALSRAVWIMRRMKSLFLTAAEADSISVRGY